MMQHCQIALFDTVNDFKSPLIISIFCFHCLAPSLLLRISLASPEIIAVGIFQGSTKRRAWKLISFFLVFKQECLRLFGSEPPDARDK